MFLCLAQIGLTKCVQWRGNHSVAKFTGLTRLLSKQVHETFHTGFGIRVRNRVDGKHRI